jgi:hypothetical protein
MPKKRKLDLSTLDDKLLDGIKFCSKVYDLFDQVRAEPDGIGKLRLQPTKREKRLIEELLPIAQYIQFRYGVGNWIKVRWLSGSQPYDALLWSPLLMVQKAGVPRKMFVEVTTSIHENAHIARKMLHEGGFSFGPKSIRINKQTGVPESVPHVNVNDENVSDLTLQIIERLTAKALKGYPANTVLIVNCNADGLIFEDEWNNAIERVKSTQLHKAFREVFLIDPVGRHFSSLWTGRKSNTGKLPHKRAVKEIN